MCTKEEDKLWEKVKRDFPYDPALQEVHYARLKIHAVSYTHLTLPTTPYV